MNPHITPQTSAAIRSNRLGSSLNALAISLALAFGLSPEATYAQSTTPTQINIPAQSLNQALLQLGQQTDIQIYYLPETVANLNAPAVSGTLTAEQALVQLLRGTGIDVRWNGKTASLSKLASGEATQLAPVVVTASGSPVTEGTGSYVASHIPSTTATPLGLTIKETPQTISVLTRQQLDDQSIVVLRDALAQAPGISFSDMGSERYTVLSRGYGIDSYQLDGVPTTLDMTTQTVPQSLADLVVYDRVELLRGAAGLSIGAGDPSGTLNFIRKRPTQEFQGHISLGVGSWSLRRGEADFSGALNKAGTLRGRVVGAWQKNDTHLDYYRQEKQTLYGIIEADLTESTLLTAGIEYRVEDPRGSSIGSGLPLFYNDGGRTDFSRSTNLSSRHNTNRTRNVTTFASLRQDLFADWKLEASVNHMNVTRDYRGVVFGNANSANAFVNRQTGLARLLHTAGKTDQEQTGFKINIGGPFRLLGREHYISVGVDHTEYTDLSNYVSIYTVNGLDTVNWAHEGTVGDVDFNRDSDTRIKQSGIHMAGKFQITDQLSLIAGGRYGKYRNHYGSAQGAGNYSYETLQEKNGFFTPYAGLTYAVNDQHTLYASYTTIYLPQSLRDRNGSYLDPREGANYEAGIKSDWLGSRLTSSVSIYQIRQDNLAEVDAGYTVPGTVNSAAYVGVQGAKTTGFDIELNGELVRGWNLTASYTYGQTKGADGNHIKTTVPKHMAKLWTTYRLPGALNRLTVGGGVNWQSEMLLTATPWFANGELVAQQSSYAVVNLMARYDFSKNLSATLNVNNLFDKKYMSSFDSTFYTGTYGTPRNVLLNVEYAF